MKPREANSVPGYELEGMLGRGSFGEVWAAVRLADGQPVALKVLHSPGEEARLRFRREARAASLVVSAHVCRVIDAGTEGEGPLFIAYERLLGETLDARLDRDGDLSLVETLALADDLLDALAAAHAVAIVHRDVKPANVFIETAGDAMRARLLDFGVAKSPDDQGDDALSTTGGATLGSLAYMAPEQAGSAKFVDARADLYGLGAVMFRALAGRPPFAAASPATMLTLKLERDPPALGAVTGDSWPALVESFLRGLLARDPARRYPSAVVAREALHDVTAQMSAAGRGSVV